MAGDGVASQGASAARSAFHKTIESVTKYIAPVGGVVAGFFSAPLLGGGQAIANVFYNAVPGQTTGNWANRVGSGIIALVWAGIGGLFWHMRSAAGWVSELIGGLAGGFFFGAALGNVPNVISGNHATSGFVETFASGVQSAAGGN